MNIEEGQLRLDIDEESLIVQSNSMAMARYSMTALEQKVFLIILSTINKNDVDFNLTTLRVKDMADIMKVHPNILYRDLKKICKNLLGNVIEIPTYENDWELVTLFKYAKYKGKDGTVTFKINEEAKPYLLELRELFFKMEIGEVLLLDGKYSLRLYQIAKSNLFSGVCTITIDELKNVLKLTQKSYNKFSNIKNKVITPSLDEINSKTEINISCEYIKTGKEIKSIKLIIKNNKRRKAILKPSKSSFNNFTPRNYNYEDLEKGLLGWDDSITIEDVTLD